MRMKWTIHTKNGKTFIRPDLPTCPFTIEVNLGGGKHSIFDVRLYSNGGSTNYQKIGETGSLYRAQSILRDALKKEQRA